MSLGQGPHVIPGLLTCECQKLRMHREAKGSGGSANRLHTLDGVTVMQCIPSLSDQPGAAPEVTVPWSLCLPTEQRPRATSQGARASSTSFLHGWLFTHCHCGCLRSRGPHAKGKGRRPAKNHTRVRSRGASLSAPDPAHPGSQMHFPAQRPLCCPAS